jgi:phosphoribosylformimino-5-aminoimidazole carboxamide ribotide isomerase
MIAIPAVDLRGGACVQLVGGSFAAERVHLPDPVGVSLAFARAGFGRLHVIDLDAATGRGSNRSLVEGILFERPAEVQVGGGVREADHISDLLSAGASRVIVGTRALEDPDWLADVASQFPGAVVLAADVRQRRITTHGWTRTLACDPFDLLDDISHLPLAGLLVTAVDREGRLEGPDLPLMEDLAERCTCPLLAAGGVATLGDLRALEGRGVTATVIGMALYTGALDPRTVAMEFSE